MYNDAEFENNQEQMIRIDKERESIEADLKFQENKKYYAPKNLSEERKKVCNLIRKSFSDFYKSINAHEELYLHLRNSIKVSNGYKYSIEDLSSYWLLTY